MANKLNVRRKDTKGTKSQKNKSKRRKNTTFRRWLKKLHLLRKKMIQAFLQETGLNESSPRL